MSLTKKQIELELAKLTVDFNTVYQKINIDQRRDELVRLEEDFNQPNTWNDPDRAQQLAKNIAKQQDFLQPWLALQMQLQDYQELLNVDDDAWLDEAAKQVELMQQQFAKMKRVLVFDGKYDANDAIVRLTSGVGGIDAQDFTEMLERMYLRFWEKRNWSVTLVERQTGDEAGIKTAVYEVSGNFVYGNLKSEHGVHRLVRLSPFNADNLRQTSFALVEVLPKIAGNELKINPVDLKIDYYRSGGHGGQSVNTTDSAVRITHLPTNTTVAIQNERSQIQNKAVAMSILMAKLLELQEQQQEVSDISHLKAGESASWGAQIRNYVMHPYTLVKDTRTKYQETDIQKVLDGEIEGFIEAYLQNQI
ncbi:MAG: peptide chain release factor 2 [Candidatus Saccharibacteria bacterium]|nr:peptide chain release factor 2 [Candidatus Saccharibacteria bacterium]